MECSRSRSPINAHTYIRVAVPVLSLLQSISYRQMAVRQAFGHMEYIIAIDYWMEEKKVFVSLLTPHLVSPFSTAPFPHLLSPHKTFEFMDK